MTQRTPEPDPADAGLAESDPGDERGSIPGLSPDKGSARPDEAVGDDTDTGGPDSQLAADKD